MEKDLLQEICVTFLEAFDTDAVELGIVDDLSALALVLEEGQELTPGDLFVVAMIQLVNQLLQTLTVKVDLFLELALEFDDGYALNFGGGPGGGALGPKLRKQFFYLR